MFRGKNQNLKVVLTLILVLAKNIITFFCHTLYSGAGLSAKVMAIRAIKTNDFLSDIIFLKLEKSSLI